MTRFYKINKDGMGSGGALCPPGHYNHTYALEEFNGPRGRVAQSYTSLDYIDNEYADPSPELRAAVDRIRSAAKLVESELYVRNVYGYFKNMYVPESGDRNARGLIRDPGNTLPPERHAAVACIRKYFPKHEPRLDLIADPGKGYGSYPCAKCGERVQYEARFDALTKVSTRMDSRGMTHWSYETACTDGGSHTID